MCGHSHLTLLPHMQSVQALARSDTYKAHTLKGAKTEIALTSAHHITLLQLTPQSGRDLSFAGLAHKAVERCTDVDEELGGLLAITAVRSSACVRIAQPTRISTRVQWRVPFVTCTYLTAGKAHASTNTNPFAIWRKDVKVHPW